MLLKENDWNDTGLGKKTGHQTFQPCSKSNAPTVSPVLRSNPKHLKVPSRLLGLLGSFGFSDVLELLHIYNAQHS